MVDILAGGKLGNPEYQKTELTNQPLDGMERGLMLSNPNKRGEHENTKLHQGPATAQREEGP